jgi:hypothetical protein
MFATLAILHRDYARRQHEWMPTALSRMGRTDKMGSSCRACGAGEGAMDGLIGRRVANIAIDRATVEKASGIILDFRAEEDSPNTAHLFLAKPPGAEAQQAASEDGSGVGGVMGAAMRMRGGSLSIGDALSVTHQFITYACEKVGGDEGGECVAAIPAQFV